MKIPNENEAESVHSNEDDSPDGAGGPPDFSEYMWMENQEEFDRQVLQELEEVVGRSPSPPRDPGDFSEFMWMENEEEFDKEVLRQLEEEALMKQCIESMLEDEDSSSKNSDFVRDFNNLRVQDSTEIAQKSTLNPNAAEFVPKVEVESK
ncbi:hypothetical protein GE061_005357 [Apolygus lucorum]|uniref:Ataxin-2 C-terminal domain-containing protein n=1 Tax=Apolygus lucorum TaxID=248454 RepID=A0A8S9WVE6_APOLU|nr:hypothetical protein GE061_005357 [Apolygus lucorum]